MQIQISWLLQKPADLDLHCLQRQGISGFSRTRVNVLSISYECTEIFNSMTVMQKKIKNKNDSNTQENLMLRLIITLKCHLQLQQMTFWNYIQCIYFSEKKKGLNFFFMWIVCLPNNLHDMLNLFLFLSFKKKKTTKKKQQQKTNVICYSVLGSFG